MVQELHHLAERVDRLLICSAVFDSPVGRPFVALLDQAARGSATTREGAKAYACLFGNLASEIELARVVYPGNPWQQHVIRRLLADDNLFSQKVRQAGRDAVGGSVLEAMRHDLALLHDCCAVRPEALAALAGHAVPALSDLVPVPGATELPADERALAESLCGSDDWAALLPRLAEHYARHGTGIFAGFVAFRWVREPNVAAERGRLVGIDRPDPVRLADLVGYESERRLLVQNTEQFLAGLPANNALLYGDRGTGKSSTVKALVHAYAARGLRMIEVSKGGLDDFPAILHHIRGRQERFILFLDDLSFEEHETHYKDLKAVLEGSLEAKPENVLLYATSNRRHLIKERFGDRSSSSGDEIHAQDTMQEKLSLSDRFGIALTFLEPDQDQYLAIVEATAARCGVAMGRDELRRRALQWASWHNGRSGRTARQFVDQIVGEQGLASR